MRRRNPRSRCIATYVEKAHTLECCCLFRLCVLVSYSCSLWLLYRLSLSLMLLRSSLQIPGYDTCKSYQADCNEAECVKVQQCSISFDTEQGERTHN